MSKRALGILFGAAALFALVPSAHATKLYVANNGGDALVCGLVVLGSSCGSKASPCRSISCAMAFADPGDTIIVGPGRYAADTGETPAAGCGCMLAVNKPVKLMSSDGAAVTLIDGRTAAVNRTVLIIANDAEFGRPGGGFFVTQSDGPTKSGMVIDGDDVSVRGNQLIPIFPDAISSAIATVNSPGKVLIEGNQIVGWASGIVIAGANKTVRKNVLLENSTGIFTAAGSEVTGNVVVDNTIGIKLNDGAATVTGNAAIGNGLGISNNPAGPPNGADFTGVVQKNAFIGNDCGLRNDGVIGLLADKNYWGAATGPGSAPADDVCNTSGGTTTVSPFSSSAIKVKAPIKP